MKTKINCTKLVFAILFSATYLFSTSDVSLGQDMMGPLYSSPKTKEIIQKMIQAHGGMKVWQDAKSVSFDNIFFNPSAEQMEWPSPWWVSHEVIDPRTRQAYHDWPLDGAQLSYDGNQVWTVDWAQANSPKMQALFFYYFIGLPWLTQDQNVKLSQTGKGMLPGFEKEFITVTMTFKEKPAVGKTDKDSFKFYIDPDTHLLQGYEYVMGFGAMLDAMGMPDGQLMGPMLRIHDKFAKVDGLTLPAEMHTMAPDGSMTYGHHVINNYSLNKPFDQKRMKKPSNAVVDNSSAMRKMSKK